MKRIHLLFLLLSMALLGGCYDEIDTEINRLERRIEKLEQRCQEINTTLQGLQTILNNLEKYDFITGVNPLYDGQGNISGYNILFSHSDPIVLFNGTDAETPILGVGRGDDGVWYWTVKYPSDEKASFVTDNYGVKIPTDAGSPLIKIENGYWMVSYDNGEIWHNLGRATGEDGASFFSSVTDMGDYVAFNLLNGTTVNVPTWSSFEKLQQNCKNANDNLAAFTQLVKHYTEKVYVSDLIPILNGTDTVGFSLVLSDGNSYSFRNGNGTNVPVIGAKRDASKPLDEVWYWTIQYGSDPVQWILDEKGNKIQANAPDGLTPRISLKQAPGDEAWYWAVAYGDGEAAFLLHDGAKVRVDLTVPDAIVQSIVSVQEDKVCITLLGGLSFDVPLPKAFSVTLKAPVTSNNTLEVAAADTAVFHCILSGVDSRAEVLPVAEESFYATASSADHRDWTITVITPYAFAKPSTSRLNLLVSNGYGEMKTIVVTLVAKN